MDHLCWGVSIWTKYIPNSVNNCKVSKRTSGAGRFWGGGIAGLLRETQGRSSRDQRGFSAGSAGGLRGGGRAAARSQAGYEAPPPHRSHCCRLLQRCQGPRGVPGPHPPGQVFLHLSPAGSGGTVLNGHTQSLGWGLHLGHPRLHGVQRPMFPPIPPTAIFRAFTLRLTPASPPPHSSCLSQKTQEQSILQNSSYIALAWLVAFLHHL